jgi:hypothetical protein
MSLDGKVGSLEQAFQVASAMNDSQNEDLFSSELTKDQMSWESGHRHASDITEFFC